MPRKVASKRGNVSFVPRTSTPTKRDVAKSAAVGRILGRTLSQKFMDAYEVSLATFVEYRAAVTNSSPAAVSARIEAVIKSATALMRTVEQLELTDRMLIGECETRRLEDHQPYVGQQKLLRTLDLFLPVVEEAENIIAKESRHGRMQAYAERSLAVSLGQMLFDETKVMPTQKTGGQFDRLLHLAFTHSKIKPRKDVTKLMAYALPHIRKEDLVFPSELEVEEDYAKAWKQTHPK